MRYLFILTFSLILLSGTLNAQTPMPNEGGLVKWYSFKEAFELNKKQPKPFLIDIYTDWCGWCKHMMKTTYADPGLSSYINTYFYPVKFDAETQDTVEYLGEKYVNRSKAKKSTHDLAIKLLGGKLSYPSTIFSNNNFQFNLLSAGYLEVKKIEPFLIFTVENAFRTSNFDDFNAAFEKTFYDTTSYDKAIKWKDFDEVNKLQKKKNKKTIVFLSTDWCNTGKVMKRTSFMDEKTLKMLEEDFYIVNLNAQSKDTIEFKGVKYPPSANPAYFHPILQSLTQSNIVLPSMIILDKENKTLDNVQGYMKADIVYAILNFYAKDIYLKQKWDEYFKELNAKK